MPSINSVPSFYSWSEESKTGQASPQAKAVNPADSDRQTKTTPWGSPQRLNASPVLLVECWRTEKLWTNDERSNQSSFLQTSVIVYWTILYVIAMMCNSDAMTLEYPSL